MELLWSKILMDRLSLFVSFALFVLPSAFSSFSAFYFCLANGFFFYFDFVSGSNTLMSIVGDHFCSCHWISDASLKSFRRFLDFYWLAESLFVSIYNLFLSWGVVSFSSKDFLLSKAIT